MDNIIKYLNFEDEGLEVLNQLYRPRLGFYADIHKLEYMLFQIDHQLFHCDRKDMY